MFYLVISPLNYNNKNNNNNIFTLKNYTICPHSVFMCFVWLWEQTAIISLYSINWLVFIIGRECVYCAVRFEYLNTIQAFRSL